MPRDPPNKNPELNVLGMNKGLELCALAAFGKQEPLYAEIARQVNATVPGNPIKANSLRKKWIKVKAGIKVRDKPGRPPEMPMQMQNRLADWVRGMMDAKLSPTRLLRDHLRRVLRLMEARRRGV